MRVVVVGAGVAGLGTGLALSRAGHRVTLLEQDEAPLPADPDEAFAWQRPGAAQVRHSHALLARLRNLLRDEFPDVLADLLAAGASEIRFAEMLPETVLDRGPRPGDDDLVALACRRTTFEWVLRRATLSSPRVSLRDRCHVEGFEFAGVAGTVPTVSGIRLAGGESLDADMVVLANGRRSPLAKWLAEAGLTLDEREEDTGIIYYSRFYRLADGSESPARNGPIGGDLGYCKYAVFDGDNRTFSITLACATDDVELRRRFADSAGFTRSAAALVATAPWVAAGVADPMGDVHMMTSLVNRRRAFVDPSGEPLVLGMHAVGDAHTCTNPLYGRGCSLAMVQALLLADAVAEYDGCSAADAAARARTYEAACAREVLPWYRAALAQDRMNRQRHEAESPREGHAVETRPVPVGKPDEIEANPMGLTNEQIRELMVDGLMPAVRTDPDVFRAFLRGFNLLEPPQQLMADQQVVAKVMEAYQARDNRPPEPAMGPADRESLLAM